ncbi:MAG: hypothetical protein EOM54_02920 [Clostridia bacterium]|nr:hypothetical protein [Clostridia bacterium]
MDTYRGKRMLRKPIRTLLAAALSAALLITGAFAVGGGTGEAVYTNGTELTDGLTYENDISYTTAGRRVETFTLENTEGSSVHPIVLACDTIYGGLTMPQMISYAESLGYNVVGAVNADFGYWDTRIPCGMVVEDGVYKSSPEGNNAIAFSDGSAFTSFMPEVNITLNNTTAGNSVSLTHYNKSRADDGLYLYSEYFSTVSTRTSTEGWFVRMKVLDGQMTLEGEMTLEVTELIDGDYDAVEIGEDNIILTAAEASDMYAEFEKFSVGDRIILTTACSDESLASAQWVSGCGNIIVSEGAIFHSEWWDSAIKDVNPRTAIGIKADGSIVYYVMDGRTTASRGATLSELAQDMMSMGCVYAVNMDGGGSSAMSMLMPGNTGCAVLNSPSDGYLRAVCSYILFVTDEIPTGAAENLFIAQDGEFILCGSSAGLSYLATDNTLQTVGTPADTTVSSSLGTVMDGVYTAGNIAGADTISLSSESTGASGTGSLHVIKAADDLEVLNSETGRTMANAILEQDEELSLSVTARYLMRDVIMDASAVTYTVSGNVGTITEDGVFTASGDPGAEGKITIAAAGVTAEVGVKLTFEFSDMKDHWAADYVKELYEAGIVNGTTDTTYSPEAGMKRCDFVLMLYRAAGEPEIAGAVTFSDVTEDAYYAEAVAWAEENGIAKGDGTGAFDPAGTLTREQGFTFLYRSLNLLGVSFTDGDTSQLTAFTDAGEVSDWAVTPAATLVKLGIVQGSAGNIAPLGTLTRAQMAKILCVTLYRT